MRDKEPQMSLVASLDNQTSHEKSSWSERLSSILRQLG